MLKFIYLFRNGLMSELKTRLATLAMTGYGLSLNGFENYCGLPMTTLNKMGEGISIRNLSKILRACPDIDFYYLITGEHIEDNPKVISGDVKIPRLASDSEAAYKTTISELQGQITALQNTMKLLIDQIGKGGGINQSLSL